MNVFRTIPFPLQERFYRGLTGSLKYVVGALQLVIRPTEVFAGPGASLLLCDAVVGSGVTRLLVVTDAMLVKLGLVEPIVQRLRQRCIDVTVYDGVLPDPQVEQCEAVLAVLQQHGCKAVLAVECQVELFGLNSR